MMTITLVASGPNAPALGEECRFALRGEPVASVEYFLEHEGVFYPRPLPHDHDQSIRLFPEAPGRYALHAAWHSTQGDAGWARSDFDVKGAVGSAPQRVKVGNDTLWVPAAWDARVMGTHEQHVLRALEGVVGPGATVYDIGANVGLFAVRFARWIGADGWLYALEPNPICVHFLRANLELTGRRNFTILPVGASDRRAESSFALNYGSSLIGVGAASVFRDKPGHVIRVEMDTLDHLIAAFMLRKPDLVKLDVEGAEAAAVAGMMDTLTDIRPTLMIELHGRAAAAATLTQLARLQYQWSVPATGTRWSTAEALLDSLPEACVQIIGSPP